MWLNELTEELQNATPPALKIKTNNSETLVGVHTQATASGVCGQKQGRAIAAHAYLGGRQMVCVTLQAQLASWLVGVESLPVSREGVSRHGVCETPRRRPHTKFLRVFVLFV